MLIEFQNPEPWLDLALSSKETPCLLDIDLSYAFQLSLTYPQPEISGWVIDWDLDAFKKRTSMFSLGGGDRLYLYSALASFEKIAEGRYKITELSIFSYSRGWFPIIKNEKYLTEYLGDAEPI